MSLQEIAKAFAFKNLPDSEIELTGEVPFELLTPYRERAVKHLAEHMELPGFRPGKVPAEMALKKVGEQAALEEAVELFVKDFYPVLIEERKLDAVGRPDIRVTKLAAGNPLGLSIRTTLYPEVTLPKHWKNVGETIRLEPYTGELPKAEPPPSEEDQQKARAMLSHNIRRGKLIEALLKDTKVEVPRLFVESELEKIMAQMREDILKMGIKFDDYLKHSRKTEADIRKEFAEQAAKRAKLQLTLNKIATEEKVEADPTAVEHEMKRALEHFPAASPELLRIHIETVLKNELVLKLLESETK